MIGMPTVHLIKRLRAIVVKHPDLTTRERRAIEDAQVVIVCAIGRMAASQRVVGRRSLRAARVIMRRSTP